MNNIKLYSFYRTFSYDIFFYYAISFFYFLTVKNLTVAQIVLLEALYPVYGIIFQVPAACIIKKIGIKNSIILENTLWLAGFIGYIISPTIIFIILSDLFFALGNSLKQIADPIFLMESLKTKNKESDFNKVEGKGIAVYYYIETITSILSGFLFVVNPYIPFVLGITMVLVSILIALQFKEIEYNHDISTKKLKEKFNNFRENFVNILKNKRLQALLLFSSLFVGIIAINSSYYVIFLKNFGIDVEQFSLVFAILSIIRGIATQNQYMIERKTKNKTLSYLSIVFVSTLIIIGILGLSNFNNIVIVALVICIVVIQKIVEGTYEVSMSKYILNFTTMDTAPNIEMTYVLFKDIGKSTILFIGSYLIGKTNINNAYLIYGLASFAIVLFLISFMKERVGIKIEESSN
jgi:hypothetical protein